jgi:hypothetical protein
MPKFTPLPKLRVQIPYERRFSKLEIDRIGQNIIPCTMDERWFAYLKPPCISLVRNWTRFTVFRLRFSRCHDSYKVVEAWANRDPRQYTELSAERDAENLRFVIDAVIVGAEEELGER